MTHFTFLSPSVRAARRGVLTASTVAAFAIALGVAGPASAAVYSYVDWTEADVAAGTASGIITLSDDSTMTVTFEAINPDDTPGNLFGAQVAGGTNYWTPDLPFLSAQVENAPPDEDILQLTGGLQQTYIVHLSEPIKDPIMAIVSLGAPGTQISYDFDAPFTIVSQGTGFWGGTDTSLSVGEGDVLFGEEGHGTIQFIGSFSTFSWTAPLTEGWHGFTFGIRTTERLEPTPVPDAGVPDAGGVPWADGGAPVATDGDGGAVGDGTDAGTSADDTDSTYVDGSNTEQADTEEPEPTASDTEVDDDEATAENTQESTEENDDESGDSDSSSEDDDDADDDGASGSGVAASCKCEVPGAASSSGFTALFAFGLLLAGAALRVGRRRS
jgi:MYXO-CTERM domain-containing protein